MNIGCSYLKFAANLMIKKFLKDDLKNEVLGKEKDRNFFWSFDI